ncbi:hypothetical protein D9M72_378490 [compost metagenome]
MDVIHGDNHAAMGLQSFQVGAERGSVINHLVGGKRRNGPRGQRRAAVVILCRTQRRGEHELGVASEGKLRFPLIAHGGQHADTTGRRAAVLKEELQNRGLSGPRGAGDHHCPHSAFADGPENLQQFRKDPRPANKR